MGLETFGFMPMTFIFFLSLIAWDKKKCSTHCHFQILKKVRRVSCALDIHSNEKEKRKQNSFAIANNLQIRCEEILQ